MSTPKEIKQQRNEDILQLHNEGKSVGEIAKLKSMSKAGVFSVLGKAINKADIPVKIENKSIKLTGNEERIISFGGLVRTNVNEYANEKTGETFKVAFVKAKSKDECGYFVKLNS